MLHFYLYNTATGRPEIEYVTDNWNKMKEFYWNFLNEELDKYVKTDGELAHKIDWWENEYQLKGNLKPEFCIVFDNNTQKYKINLNNSEKDDQFWATVDDFTLCRFTQLIHTSTRRATDPPLKRLSIRYVSSDCLPVMRKPLVYEQNPNEPPVTAAV